ncbi:MAG TPA: TetR/AcrR family transcriptional regulator [Bacillota bacterium]|nr:TetR/AcrR family transcriptional regulator [Bacillota bacterium]
MSIQERKEREKIQRRELILNAASDIIAVEGIENLSVRKIANKIEYSPAIVYHYFEDKDDIVNQLMNKGYQKIIDALSLALEASDQPDRRLKELTKNYINTALMMPDEFMAVHLSSSPAVLDHTASLFKGASLKNPALGILFQSLKDILKEQGILDSSIELTAQVFISAVLGLIIKLIVENIDGEQRTRLIEHLIKCIVDGMVLGKSLEND